VVKNRKIYKVKRLLNIKMHTNKSTKKLMNANLLEFMLAEKSEFNEKGIGKEKSLVRELIYGLYRGAQQGVPPQKKLRRIEKVKDLYNLTGQEMYLIPHIGRKTWGRLNDYLIKHKLEQLPYLQYK